MDERKGQSSAAAASGPAGASSNAPVPCPVVAIGASAGGVEAVSRLLEHLPRDTGAAFLVVLHLDPDHESRLAEVFARSTEMAVVQITDRMPIEPDRVHVIAPDVSLSVEGASLRLRRPEPERALRHPVDELFQSLAGSAGERAVAVVMSGTGTNGSVGLAEIKARDGIIFAQDPATAAFDGMPKSAIDTELVDQVLEPAALAGAIADCVTTAGATVTGSDAIPNGEFKQVLGLLREHSELELQSYRRPTLARRIKRRMSIRGLNDAAEYVALLRKEPNERESLANDLMINVTSFFRDPESWEALEKEVIAPLVESKERGGEIRCWVTACSSGEEAYTLAILLTEQVAAAWKNMDIRIFATDLSRSAIDKARSGLFADGISIRVSPERLERFFERTGDRYRIKKIIREKVTFAPHNLLADPPFSRLDIATCRNFLIYLEPECQRKVLAMLHFALRPHGVLMLGSSEAARSDGGYFQTIDAQHRIYRQVGPARHDLGAFPAVKGRRQKLPGRNTGARGADDEVTSTALQALANLTSAAALLDARHRVLYFHGDTDRYLMHPHGKADLDIYGMARARLEVPIRSAIGRARHESRKAVAEASCVERGERVRVYVTATPLERDDLLLLSFRQKSCGEVRQPSAAGDTDDHSDDDKSNVVLRQELRQSHLELARTIEELEKSNEDLTGRNEEVMSINEELQSTNEELETSKEELQSLNEELATVNAQLQNKLDELETTRNNLANLLKSSDIATLFLSRDMRVNWFTPAVARLFSLIDTDIGRPITDFAQKFMNGDIKKDCQEVLKTLLPLQKECRDEDGRWYLRRTTPYRTAVDRIDGVVMTFVDISDSKGAEREAQRAAVKARQAAAAKDAFLARLSHELRTPLQPALLGLSSLAGRADVPEDIAESIEAIRRNIQIEVRLIDDLLDLTRLDHGKLRLRHERLDVLELTKDTVHLCHDQSAAKHQAVTVAGTPGEAWVSADRIRLQQVIWNLLRNAVRFTRNHGTIRLRCARRGDRVLIEVADDGIGISAELLPRIFESFERSDETFSGLGLGLSIAKSLVEAHDGTIEAESEGPGCGATFRVWLPAAPDPGSKTSGKTEKGAGADDAVSSIEELRILIIEDHRDSAQMLAALLQSAGSSTRTAATLKEALEAVKEEEFDVIISDVSLPDGNAYELSDALTQDAPVIALSGFGAAQDIERSIDAGFAEHLVKPVTLADLRYTIGRVLADRSNGLS